MKTKKSEEIYKIMKCCVYIQEEWRVVHNFPTICPVVFARILKAVTSLFFARFCSNFH